MKVTMDYGRDGLDIEVPDHAHVLQMSDAPALSDLDQKLEEALAHPIGALALRQLARDRSDACIVISDITRPVPNVKILPPMLRILEEEGIAREDITILVGTGLHRPNEGEELVQLVGEEIACSYRIVNHKARERDTLTYLGDTSGGAPIWIDTLYVESDLKIATSLIEPHLMAGYSGGRKAICPGLMGVDTMRVLHGPKLLSHANAAEGIIEGNPFHRQALEVAQRAGVDFTLNVAMNEQREVTGIFAGDLEKAHAEGVSFVQRQNGATLSEPVDMVVTSSAGLPLDLTFYQAVKGLTAALPITKKGGTVLIVARCDEGIGGPEFTDLLLNTTSVETFAQRLEDPDFFVIDQWQLQELCKVMRKANVMMFSEGIQDEDRERVLVEMVPSVEGAIARVLDERGADARIAVIPKGPYVLTQVQEVVS
ncbi:MAG: nickel-dependent lactate racemase [Candidatus Latescibacterota bacterium]|nr:nickel-dependent lactate racemase [Candidatus Latescibacterota bacterium]